MTTAQAQHDYPNRTYLPANDGYPHGFPPAHECVRLGTCYLCGAPCKVEALGEGHVTVPWCGCGRVLEAS